MLDETELMSFCITENDVLEKFGSIWRKIEYLKGVNLTALLLNDKKYIKAKIRTHVKNITNFPDQGVPDNRVECKSRAVVYIYSLFIIKKKIIRKYI